MGASGDMFLAMRAEEVAQFDSRFTKKEAEKTGENLVKTAFENGTVGKHELMAGLVRMKAVIDSAEKTCRAALPNEKIQLQGVEFTPVEGGVTINYSEDPVYAQMQKDLKDREELLKIAQKQDMVLDAGGHQVPKVGTTPRKSSITVKF